MELDLCFISLVALLLISLPTTHVDGVDSKKTKKREHRVVMRIKPNGSKWDVLGYNCNGQECIQQCRDSDGSDGKEKCDYNCECLGNLPFTLPVNCVLSETVECKEVCLGSICKDICQQTLSKKCQSVNG